MRFVGSGASEGRGDQASEGGAPQREERPRDREGGRAVASLQSGRGAGHASTADHKNKIERLRLLMFSHINIEN